ncbi:MAG: hypothetical protein IJS32_01350 [Kiritimatiellae bacterium]|nr:hypothetical protein [Kiritimatiellia bacterium]
MRKADSLVWAMAALLLGTAAAKGDSFPAVSGGTWTGSAAVRFDGREGLGSRMVHGVEWLGQPDGGGGEATDTSAWEDGWREIAAGDETTDLLSLNAPGMAVEGGRLAENTTWNASETHLVRHTVVVPNGKILTVGAGAVVKIVPGATIRVEDGGRVHFAGTEGNESVVTSVEDPDFGAAVDCGVWTNREAVTGISRQSSAATVTDNAGAVRFRFNQSDLFPTVKLQNGGGKRSDGVVRIPVTVSGTARTNAFRVDWEAVDGSAVFGEDYLAATGSVRWAKSDEGTKNIVIPVNAELLRGSNVAFTVRLTAHYACNAGTATAEAVIREFDFPEIRTGGWTQSDSVRFDGRGGLSGSVVHGEEWLGTPDGGGGEATDTSAWEDGWHEIAAEDETANILSLNAPDIAVEGGRLAANAEWTSNVTHLVRHAVVVPSGKTLSVGPGTVVKFLPGTVIRVEDGGTLSVAGEAGRDAIFTSAADARFGAAVDCGDFLPGAVHPDNEIGGVVTQSSAATFRDNGFLQLHSFRIGSYPYVKLRTYP